MHALSILCRCTGLLIYHGWREGRHSSQESQGGEFYLKSVHQRVCRHLPCCFWFGAVVSSASLPVLALGARSFSVVALPSCFLLFLCFHTVTVTASLEILPLGLPPLSGHHQRAPEANQGCVKPQFEPVVGLVPLFRLGPENYTQQLRISLSVSDTARSPAPNPSHTNSHIAEPWKEVE